MAEHKRLSLSTFNGKMQALAGLAIVLALLLTVYSYSELCSEQCAAAHHYRLFGMPFEVFGLIFFSGLAAVHLLGRRYETLQHLESLLFASALGAELMFIIIQKFTIGRWCPVCLAIATSVAAGAGAKAAVDIKAWRSLRYNGDKGGIMKTIQRGLSNTTAVILGFFIAYMGVTKYDALQAAEASVQNKLAFGKTNSVIEAYLFTDWNCPACRKLEPQLHELCQTITKEGKLIFVDHVMHPETLNYIPYNLSFIINDKGDYYQLREMLTQMSQKTGSPTEEQIAAAAAKLGVKYKELNYADIAFAIKYYKKIGEKFKVEGTPTLVIINRQSKKGKKLAGLGEITEKNVRKAIDTLQKT